MCFYSEPFWIARVVEKTSAPAKERTWCDECGRDIEAGQTLHTLDQQEYEECQACEAGECKCPADSKGDPNCCQCDEPGYGETYHHEECDDCHKFLKAVALVEDDEGCGRDESRPALGRMVDSLCELGAAECKKYYRRAAQEHPELVASGYLKWLWKEVFGG